MGCDICEQLLKCGGSVNEESARVSMLLLLCQGGYQLFCDSNNADAPILVRPGTLLPGQTLVAYHLNGTPYTGAVSTLGPCVGAAGGAGSFALTKTVTNATLSETVADGAVTISVIDAKSAAFYITGFAGGSIVTFEGSLGSALADPWFTVSGKKADGTPVTTANANGVYYFDVSALNRLRFRVSTTGSGTLAYYTLKSTV